MTDKSKKKLEVDLILTETRKLALEHIDRETTTDMLSIEIVAMALEKYAHGLVEKTNFIKFNPDEHKIDNVIKFRKK